MSLLPVPRAQPWGIVNEDVEGHNRREDPETGHDQRYSTTIEPNSGVVANLNRAFSDGQNGHQTFEGVMDHEKSDAEVAQQPGQIDAAKDTASGGDDERRPQQGVDDVADALMNLYCIEWKSFGGHEHG